MRRQVLLTASALFLVFSISVGAVAAQEQSQSNMTNQSNMPDQKGMNQQSNATWEYRENESTASFPVKPHLQPLRSQGGPAPWMDVWKVDSSCMGQQSREGLADVQFSSQDNAREANFRGVIETPSPESGLDFEVADASGVQENLYRMNIQFTEPQQQDGQTCKGRVHYQGLFQFQDDFALEIYHNGTKIQRIQSPGYSPALAGMKEGRSIGERTGQEADQVEEETGDRGLAEDAGGLDRQLEEWTMKTFPQWYDGQGLVRIDPDYHPQLRPENTDDEITGTVEEKAGAAGAEVQEEIGDFERWTRRTYPQLYDDRGIVQWD